jgi:hypothetical protein
MFNSSDPYCLWRNNKGVEHGLSKVLCIFHSFFYFGSPLMVCLIFFALISFLNFLPLTVCLIFPLLIFFIFLISGNFLNKVYSHFVKII